MNSHELNSTIGFITIRTHIAAVADALLIEVERQSKYYAPAKYNQTSRYIAESIDTILPELINRPQIIEAFAANESVSLSCLNNHGLLSPRLGKIVHHAVDHLGRPFPEMQKDISVFTREDWVNLFRMPNFGTGRITEVVAFMAICKTIADLKHLDSDLAEKRVLMDQVREVLAGPGGARKVREMLQYRRNSWKRLKRHDSV